MAQLPRPVAEIGVKLLQTEWIRDQANQMAYYDKAGYATKEATRVGRLHTFLPGRQSRWQHQTKLAIYL